MENEKIRQKLKNTLSLMMAVVLVFALIPPLTARAAEVNVTYVDETGTEKSKNAIKVTDALAASNTLTTGWYVVNSNVNTNTILVSGDVHLILADGCTLEADGGTDTNAGINVVNGNSLTIYGQLGGTGKLIAKGGTFVDSEGAGIGGQGLSNSDSGNVTINGGTVVAMGFGCGAGIGGGGSPFAAGDGGNVIINGGTVTATSNKGAGIGGGGGSPFEGGDGGNVIINGGTVTAISYDRGAGIGGGYSDGSPGGAGGNVTINGGTVTATGNGGGAGIGGGLGSYDMGTSGTVVISGGAVKGSIQATPTNGSGIDSKVVFLTKVVLEGINAATKVVSLTESTGYYGIKDLYIDDSGNLYLWLPDKATITKVETASHTYLGSVTASGIGTLYELPPTVTNVSPNNGEGNAAVSGNIGVTFDKAMSTTAGTVTLTKSGSSPLTLNAANGSWSADKRTYTIPYSGIDYNTAYTLDISGFKNMPGATMTAYSSSFTTEIEPLTPTVSPDTLTLNKGSTANFAISFGQGANVTTDASISVDSGSIASVSQTHVTTPGAITVTGLAVGTTDITVTFSDILSTVKTVSVTVKPVDPVQPVAPVWPYGSSLTGSNITQTGATLTWTAAQDNTGVSSYKIYQNGTLIKTVDGTILSCGVNGLSASTAYSFSVQAGNADGVWTTDGPAVTFTTKAASSGGGSSSSGGTNSAGSSSSLNNSKTYQAGFYAGGGVSSHLPIRIDLAARRAVVELNSVQGKLLADGRSIEISIPAVPDIISYGVTLPVSSVMAKAGGTLTLKSHSGNIIIPSNMLPAQPGNVGKTVMVVIGQGDVSSLLGEAKAAIGNRPVIQLTLSIDGKQIEWNNPEAPVTVSIPYTPAAEELKHPDSVVVWCVDGSGKLICVPNGHYDAASGMVTFETTHFSLYAVGYNPVRFNDVAEGSWYEDAVSFIAARNIAVGVDNGNYRPGEKLTRGEFIVMLMRAYGITEDANSEDNFADAGSAYYTGYLAAAKRLGVSNGVGSNLFAPEKQITRQELFVLLYNALKTLNQLPEGAADKNLSDFTDSREVSPWAKEAITLLVKTGTISGSNKKLAPANTTTRAEMAQILYNLLGNNILLE